jgi:hypothetical protein
MANKSKSKGSYHERKIVEWLQEIGVKAKRQPLSGSLGGEYSGDIKLEILGLELIGEVKYRDTSGFPSPFTVLNNRNMAFYKRRRGTPQTIVILDGDVFQKLMENINATAKPDGVDSP